MLKKPLACLATAALLSTAQEPVNLRAIHEMKMEAFENSKVMDTVFQLTDVNGPRLTNSPGHRSAADWVVKELKSYGLTNVHLEPFKAFGRSWNYTRYEGHMLAPSYQPLIGYPMAWSEGTNGVAKGEATIAVLATNKDLEKFKGKLKGKIVLIDPLKDLSLSEAPMGRRLSDKELAERSVVQDPSRMGYPVRGGGRTSFLTDLKRADLNKFLKDEGVLVAVRQGYNGDGGTVFATAQGSRDAKEAVPPCTIVLTAEHYNRIYRLLDKKQKVELSFEVQAKILEETTDSFNVIGEIRGTTKPSEIVMLGGHLDSWHGGTGATDNATGTAIAMEAVRILTKLKLPMDRTVRIALWGGEEQGLLGSIGYVEEHFAERKTMKKKAEFDKLSVYFNTDTGTGKYRGIGAGGNLMAKPIFEAWMEPFTDMGFTTVSGVTSQSTKRPGGTDHTTFTWVGLPGFGFLQDPIEYATRTHHSNMDVFDRVQKGDLMQASSIMAAFVYHSATRKEMMPRKPVPDPVTEEDLPSAQ
ncbi:MAG: M20/M25/M40 family metallo-hydrolase [Acidobacteria bacterium]|nr:M20/M25/M40 family metallo-hydrolase [Acidobacteriota bacterium]